MKKREEKRREEERRGEERRGEERRGEKRRREEKRIDDDVKRVVSQCLEGVGSRILHRWKGDDEEMKRR